MDGGLHRYGAVAEQGLDFLGALDPLDQLLDQGQQMGQRGAGLGGGEPALVFAKKVDDRGIIRLFDMGPVSPRGSYQDLDGIGTTLADAFEGVFYKNDRKVDVFDLKRLRD